MIENQSFTISEYKWGTFNYRSYISLTFDLNLGLEYRYSKLLSFWARFNNVTGEAYYLYNHYHSYTFRAMLGFSYAL